MAKHEDNDGSMWCLPGDAFEDGELPEGGVLREMREETGVNGPVVRCVADILDERGGIAAHTYLADIGDQEPALGHGPNSAKTNRISSMLNGRRFASPSRKTGRSS